MTSAGALPSWLVIEKDGYGKWCVFDERPESAATTAGGKRLWVGQCTRQRDAVACARAYLRQDAVIDAYARQMREEGR